MQGQRAQVSAHERGSGSLDAGLAEQERAAIDADGAVAPLQELAQVAPVAASQIHDRFARLDSGEAQRSDDVLAGELPRREPSRGLEEKAILVAGAQNVPFSR